MGHSCCSHSKNTPGTAAAFQVRSADGKTTTFVLLDEAQSLQCWKGTLAGREHVFLTPAALALDGDTVPLSADAPAELTLAVLPAPKSRTVNGRKIASAQDGLFHRYAISHPKPSAARVMLEPVQTAVLAPAVTKGSAGAAAPPSKDAWAQAAMWRVHLPPGLDPARDWLLRIRYAGDIARLYLGDKLLDDNFSNGALFDLGLRRCPGDLPERTAAEDPAPAQRHAHLPFGRRPFGRRAPCLRV